MSPQLDWEFYLLFLGESLSKIVCIVFCQHNITFGLSVYTSSTVHCQTSSIQTHLLYYSFLLIIYKIAAGVIFILCFLIVETITDAATTSRTTGYHGDATSSTEILVFTGVCIHIYPFN